MIHQVKLRKCFFEEKIAGRKAWELRIDDRNYQIGDYIGENEIDEAGNYTGRFVVEKIVDIVYPGQVPKGALGKGYVILSTIPCEVNASFGELPSSDFNFNGLVCGEEIEKRCTTCKYFVGCECHNGKACDEYEVDDEQRTR